MECQQSAWLEISSSRFEEIIWRARFAIFTLFFPASLLLIFEFDSVRLVVSSVNSLLSWNSIPQQRPRLCCSASARSIEQAPIVEVNIVKIFFCCIADSGVRMTRMSRRKSYKLLNVKISKLIIKIVMNWDVIWTDRPFINRQIRSAFFCLWFHRQNSKTRHGFEIRISYIISSISLIKQKMSLSLISLAGDRPIDIITNNSQFHNFFSKDNEKQMRLQIWKWLLLVNSHLVDAV